MEGMGVPCSWRSSCSREDPAAPSQFARERKSSGSMHMIRLSRAESRLSSASPRTRLESLLGRVAHLDRKCRRFGSPSSGESSFRKTVKAFLVSLASTASRNFCCRMANLTG